MPPFECAALTRSSIHRKFWGCFAAQRGQAPSPQLAPTVDRASVACSWLSEYRRRPGIPMTTGPWRAARCT
ncbi:hypothetical protein AO361_25015 [Pseudomonas fluorescens]|nr:hypothetical protein AO361_25015 [Pseudomonas fluorescens]